MMFVKQKNASGSYDGGKKLQPTNHVKFSTKID